MYTIDQFYRFDPKMQIILTLPEDWLNYWESLLREYDFKIPHRVVAGGKERYNSIKNALDKCSGDLIAVHDGVRPLVDRDTIKSCFSEAQEKGAAIPVVSIVDSMRKKNGDTTQVVDRSDYLIVQTPQCFKTEILVEAYNLPFHDGITDDASLVEEAGYKIETVIGNEMNIKITTQSDLKYAGMFLR